MNLVYENVSEETILFLRNNIPSLTFTQTKNEYEQQRLSNSNINCVWYTSKKLLIQGKEFQLEKIKKILSNQGLKIKDKKNKPTNKSLNTSSNNTWENKLTTECDFNSKIHIGSDETLKGDTFGGLVVCAFIYSPENKNELINLGIKDSKKITDEKIKLIAQKLLMKFENQISYEVLSPEEYNQIISTQSITTLLNNLHQKLGNKLQQTTTSNNEEEVKNNNNDNNNKTNNNYNNNNTKNNSNNYPIHVVDKYPGCIVGDIQITKGEEHSLAIASASIIARYLALEQFDKLSKKAGFTLPKGSTHVKAALEKISRNDLKNFAKISFKNVQKYL